MIVPDPEQPRELGAISIPEALRRVLAEIRRRDRVFGPADLCADRLHAVEAAVGYRFADDLLAVYAAAVPSLAEGYEITLDRVVAHTGALADAGAPGDLIGLGQRDRVYLALEKRATATGETKLRLVRDGALEGEPIPLLAWLERLLGDAPAAAEAPPFEPRLLRALPAGSSGRRVRHPVFGEGRVYVEIGTGPERKVKVDFPGAGLKVIQARFLEFADD